MIVRAVRPFSDSFQRIDPQDRPRVGAFIQQFKAWVTKSETIADIVAIPYSNYIIKIVDFHRLLYEVSFEGFLLYITIQENICEFLYVCSISDKRLFPD